jgi:RNA polymerase sigma factor FliA
MTERADTEMTEAEAVEAYRSFVEGVAGKLKRKLKIRVDHEDLVAYGLEGLLQAWRRYDPSNAAAFTSYAYYRVRGAMLDGCRKEGWASRDRRTNLSDYQAANAHLESHLESHADSPRASSLAESVGRASAMVGDMITIMMVRSSDLENVVVQHEPPQDVQVERKGQNARLTAALAELTEQERMIVKRHHYYDESLRSIAPELGMSVSWCSRVHARAIEKLRELLTAEGDSS